MELKRGFAKCLTISVMSVSTASTVSLDSDISMTICVDISVRLGDTMASDLYQIKYVLQWSQAS